MRTITYGKAISEALHEEMLRDESVFVMGEDMAVMGSVFGLTKGFLDEFGPNRVIDTPISEAGFSGMAVGAAIRGLRPVVELMYVDFATLAYDSIVNQAAKIRYMTGGQVKVPLVIRAPGGAGRRNAAQHSQSLENWFTHIPGLKVVAPATPYDVKGLLKTAIRDDDPVIFIEHKFCYAQKGEVPDGEYTIPFGKADIKRPGKDVTLIAYSRQTNFAMEAAEILAKDGIDVEVIDLRSLVPLDWETIEASVKKTHRAVVVHEAVKRGGYGAEIATQIMEGVFDYLDAPVKRVAALNVVIPFSPTLEDLVFPHVKDIVAGVKDVLR
ncbi:MAG: alpha-ketoacid dehydrogenase subunit beta [Rhodospirillaceae bacterium]|nr:alpha-ketoacid dehydrogenase subunit beta [Rhodospirillaceae bacterium]MEA4836809.1 alpha-ketoacid dehydrogenase subunit beta [Rhodospirillaceae bacterium]